MALKHSLLVTASAVFFLSSAAYAQEATPTPERYSIHTSWLHGLTKSDS